MNTKGWIKMLSGIRFRIEIWLVSHFNGPEMNAFMFLDSPSPSIFFSIFNKGMLNWCFLLFNCSYFKISNSLSCIYSISLPLKNTYPLILKFLSNLSINLNMKTLFSKLVSYVCIFYSPNSNSKVSLALILHFVILTISNLWLGSRKSSLDIIISDSFFSSFSSSSELSSSLRKSRLAQSSSSSAEIISCRTSREFLKMEDEFY